MNSEERKPIRDFTDLNVWQFGHELVLFIYKINKHFPKEEIFALSSQMKRAGISIISNIAEGFGRKGYKEKIQFYYLANGSLTELKNQLIIARDVGYLKKDLFEESMQKIDSTHRLLQGLIVKSRSFIKS
jgi:four helix bundle protein